MVQLISDPIGENFLVSNFKIIFLTLAFYAAYISVWNVFICDTTFN